MIECSKCMSSHHIVAGGRRCHLMDAPLMSPLMFPLMDISQNCEFCTVKSDADVVINRSMIRNCFLLIRFLGAWHRVRSPETARITKSAISPKPSVSNVGCCIVPKHDTTSSYPDPWFGHFCSHMLRSDFSSKGISTWQDPSRPSFTTKRSYKKGNPIVVS